MTIECERCVSRACRVTRHRPRPGKRRSRHGCRHSTARPVSRLQWKAQGPVWRAHHTVVARHQTAASPRWSRHPRSHRCHVAVCGRPDDSLHINKHAEVLEPYQERRRMSFICVRDVSSWRLLWCLAVVVKPTNQWSKKSDESLHRRGAVDFLRGKVNVIPVTREQYSRLQQSRWSWLMPSLIFCSIHRSSDSVLFSGSDNAQKLPLPLAGSSPHLIHGSLDPPDSTLQLTSRSLQLFLQSSQTWPKDKHTDRPRYRLQQ